MELTETDEGKRVINSHGDNIGKVVEVKHGDAYVDPDPGLADSILSKLGWTDSTDENTYLLESSNIETITEDEIRVTM